MNITAAIILFAVIWFLTFYIVLQLRTHTQEEAGEVTPGTPPGAPATEDVGRSAKIASVWAICFWILIAGIITSGWISVEDFDIFNFLD